MTFAHVRGVLSKQRFLACCSLLVFGTALGIAVVWHLSEENPGRDTVDLTRLVLLAAETALTLLWLLVDCCRCACGVIG